MKMRRAVLAMSLCALATLHNVAFVRAQSPNYPSRPIKMIVPFPAGGPTDGMARLVSDRLGAVLGQSVITENHGGGAGGSVGAKLVAAAEPDGYTILITPGGSLTTGPAVHKNIGYDPARAFTPVALLTVMPNIISVHADLPVRSLSELVTYAKTNPGKISWGSQGFGTATHLLAELFKLETGANIVHVPYRGSAPLLAAIIAGEVQMMADPSITSLPSIQAGKLRPLAIAGPERSTKLPDVRTTTEAGFPSCRPHSGSAPSRRRERRPTSSTGSTPRSAPRSRTRRRARASTISAPRSGSERRRSSASCSRRSWRSGRRLRRPLISRWNKCRRIFSEPGRLASPLRGDMLSQAREVPRAFPG
jgi:tripartite-type tricarboxylate transporter receptor subunit TctC